MKTVKKIHNGTIGQITNVYKVSACYDVSIKNYSIVSKKIKGPGANEQRAIMYIFLTFFISSPLWIYTLIIWNCCHWYSGSYSRESMSAFFQTTVPYDIINWLNICIKYGPIFCWLNLWNQNISRARKDFYKILQHIKK